ncbi:MAG: low molecular weight protein-tyrosine-phosphatase [Candidatus Sericytochromatia bacterium]
MIKVLFVCMGNICRSPVAEGHFLKLIKEQNLENKFYCDSAGTEAYHIGELSDYRTRENAKAHGMILTHRARQLKKTDFNEFDYILAMDNSNFTKIQNIYKTIENPKAKIYMMRYFDPDNFNADVPDPYYTSGMSGFEEVYQILEKSVKNFLKTI